MTRLLPIALASFAAAASSTAAIAQNGGWQIGPIIRGKNYSVGMPLAPTPTRNGWSFDFPSEQTGHVHYVTFRPGALAGATQIRVRYRVDAPRGTRFVPQEHPDMPGMVSLVFQRSGDNWSAKRQFEHFRWYAPEATMQRLEPGERVITISLSDPNWISIKGKPRGMNPEAFNAALAYTDNIGLVFGSTAARGHGVFATAPARFTLLSFEIR